jgi:RimJ/RimL family protein N-acetyltransferase
LGAVEIMENGMDLKLLAFPENKLPSIAKWRSDNDVNKYIRSGYKNLEEVRKWDYEYFTTNENHLFGIILNNQWIGYCTIEHVNNNDKKCEIGIVIGEKIYWNQGMGGLVIKELLNIAICELGMHRVEAIIRDGNEPSIHCFTRMGFRLDGILRGAKYINGNYIDLRIWVILENEVDRRK